MNFNQQIRSWLAAILLFGVPILAHGSVSDAELQKEYEGKVLTLRQPYPGDHLHFDAAGKLAGSGSPGAWTVDGQLRVKHIFLKDSVIHIQGQRLFIFFDQETKQLRELGSLTEVELAKQFSQPDKKKQRSSIKKFEQWLVSAGKTETEVECDAQQPVIADLTRVMNTVFLAPEEPLANAVPEFWKGYVTPKQDRGAALHEQDLIPRVGNGISIPHATYMPDPEFSDTARHAKHQGTLVLWLIVDQYGVPQHVRIAKPLGLGLDENAVKTIRTWKFDPAIKDGVPVAVQINVEVSFMLY